jgi:hypothetical protein
MDFSFFLFFFFSGQLVLAVLADLIYGNSQNAAVFRDSQVRRDTTHPTPSKQHSFVNIPPIY